MFNWKFARVKLLFVVLGVLLVSALSTAEGAEGAEGVSNDPRLPLKISTGEGGEVQVLQTPENGYVEMKAFGVTNVYVMAILRSEVMSKKYGNASVRSWFLEKRVPSYLKRYSGDFTYKVIPGTQEDIVVGKVDKGDVVEGLLVDCQHDSLFINGNKRYVTACLVETVVSTRKVDGVSLEPVPSPVVYQLMLDSGRISVPIMGSIAFNEIMKGINLR